MVGKKIALVTGANKGVGYGIIRQLLLQTKTPILIYLTSRDESRGTAALQKISGESDIAPTLKTNELQYHQLDITSQSSIDAARDFIKKKHGKLDILINNAGIATKGDAFDRGIVDTTISSNYHATLSMCQAFLPLINEGGRIVNVSSMAGKLGRLSSSLQSRFRDPSLTVSEVGDLMNQFAEGVQGSDPPEGWPKSAYAVSKMGVTAMTKALARSAQGRGLLINCVCPGWVRTDMAGQAASKSIDEGALTPVFVAIGDIGENTTGEFFENCALSTW